MTQHDRSLRALLILLVGILSALPAIASADGTTPLIVVSSGDVISPSAYTRYAFHRTYGEPNSGAPMPSVWIYIVAQRKPPQFSGSFNGGLSYDSRELIIPAPTHGTSAPIGLENARPTPLPAVLMVVVPNGTPQHQGPGVSVGVILMEEPDPWARPPVKADGQIQIVQPGPRRGPVR